jgi:hypothetical protein
MSEDELVGLSLIALWMRAWMSKEDLDGLATSEPETSTAFQRAVGLVEDDE